MVEIIERPDGRKVCPYDHHSSEFALTYSDMYKDLRNAGPVLWTDSHGGFWVVTEYELIRKVLMDPQTFTQEPVDGVKECGPLIPTPDEIRGMASAPGLFFFVDGPRHDTPRAALGPALLQATRGGNDRYGQGARRAGAGPGPTAGRVRHRR